MVYLRLAFSGPIEDSKVARLHDDCMPAPCFFRFIGEVINLCGRGQTIDDINDYTWLGTVTSYVYIYFDHTIYLILHFLFMTLYMHAGYTRLASCCFPTCVRACTCMYLRIWSHVIMNESRTNFLKLHLGHDTSKSEGDDHDYYKY